MSEVGVVYIFKHRSGNTVKVGETKVSATERLRSYTREYELEGFSLHQEYEVPLRARKDVEKIAHQKLRKYRLSGIGGAREIFACSEDIAEEAVRQAIKSSVVARKERAKHLRKQREEKKKEKEQRRKAQAEELFAKELNNKWLQSDEHVNSKRELDCFLRTRKQHEEKRSWLIWLAVLYFGGCGILGILGFIRGLIDGWLVETGNWHILLIVPICGGAAYFFWLIPPKKVPIASVAAQKKQMLEDLTNKRNVFFAERQKEFLTRYKNGDFDHHLD